MIRVHVLVEGQTEETFVDKLLCPHFSNSEIYLYPRLVGKPGRRGGIGEYPRARRDILATLKQEPASICTTMLDYYGMPNSWPDREVARQESLSQKPVMIEQAVLADISAELGEGFDRTRLIPYVQMHEFEALLFSDPTLLADGLDLPDASVTQHIRDQFQSPEEIDDSQQTAPSKRIERLNPGYSKVADGILIAQKIGLAAMRAECSQFNEWLQRLEALANR